MNKEVTMSKQETEVCTEDIKKHLLKTKSNEDQTTELSDDEDEAKIVHIKSNDVTNEERIIEPQETKSEIRTRSKRISKIPY